MAFNPLKNNKQFPIEKEDTSINNVKNSTLENTSLDDTNDVKKTTTVFPKFNRNNNQNLNISEIKTNEIKKPVFPIVNKNINYVIDTSLSTNIYEGFKIDDLENSGLRTIDLLKVASNNVIQKPRFNYELLQKISLIDTLSFLNAEKMDESTYLIYNQEIKIKENKWYNNTSKYGNVNPINLLKHITAIKENIDPSENDKTLYISACQTLSLLENKLSIEKNLPINNDIIDKNLSIKPINNVSVPISKENDFEKKSDSKSDFLKHWIAVTEQLDSLPLSLVAESIGANPNEDGQRGKWKIWETGHNVNITGQSWRNWNTQFGGIGSISFLAYHFSFIHNLDYRLTENEKHLKKIARNHLLKEFGTDLNIDYDKNASEVIYKEPFNMPHVIDFKINDVRQYLFQKRNIPLWIINKQIQSQTIFAGFPSDWKTEPNLNNPDKLTNDKVWAVFLSINGNAAEMRGIERTDSFAKILAKGSDKELGGFVIKAEKDVSETVVAACEAAVDTLSYHAFYPGRSVTSCMGVNFNLAVKAAISALDNGLSFELAFDNDIAGNEATVRFREQLIAEIGEDEYNDLYSQNKIRYFDLGIKCLLKTVEKGEVFYFDVKNDDIGRQAATMFQESLSKIISRETIRELITNGKIKYANVSPNYAIIKEPFKAAEEVMSLLSSNKPYYLVLKDSSPDDSEEKIKIQELFESALLKIDKTKLSLFEKQGKVVYKKQALAKDWNDFLIVMKKDINFANKILEQESKFSSYNEVKKVKKNKR